MFVVDCDSEFEIPAKSHLVENSKFNYSLALYLFCLSFPTAAHQSLVLHMLSVFYYFVKGSNGCISLVYHGFTLFNTYLSTLCSIGKAGEIDMCALYATVPVMIYVPFINYFSFLLFILLQFLHNVSKCLASHS